MSIKDKATRFARVARDTTGEASASIGAALSGNAADLDDTHRKLINRIEAGRYFQDISPYSRAVENQKEPYNTIWYMGAQGHATVVETFAPLIVKEKTPEGKIKTRRESAPAFLQIFCANPTLLDRLLLQENAKTLSKEELAQIWVVGARYKKDIEVPPVHTSHAERLNFTWARNGIKLFAHSTAQLLKEHGLLIKDSNRIWRSESSIMWANKSKAGKGFDVFYYSNPRFAKEGMFVGKKALNNPIVRGFLNLFSVRVNKEPVQEADLDVFVRKGFAKATDLSLRGKESYYMNKPDNWKLSFRLSLKVNALRSGQTLARMGRDHMSNALKKSAVTTVMVGSLVYGWKISIKYMGVAAASTVAMSKSNLIMRSLVSGAQKFRMLFAAKDITQTQNRSTEIGHLFMDKNAVEINDHLKIWPLCSKFVGTLKPVSINLFANTHRDIPSYTLQTERDWADRVLLDTYGGGFNSLLMENIKAKFPTITALQPNGLVVDHRAAEHFAYATRRYEPDPGCSLDRPHQRIFDALESRGHAYYAAKDTGNGEIETREFTDHNDFPTDLHLMPDNIPPVPTLSPEGDIKKKHPDNLLSDDARKEVMNARLKMFKRAFTKALKEEGIPHFTFTDFMEVSSEPKQTARQSLEDLLVKQTHEYYEPPKRQDIKFITAKIA